MDRLTLRNVLLYFTVDIGTFVSVWFFVLTNALLTFTFTQSPISLGIVGFAQNIPFLLFSLYGGVIADRHDRRRVVLFFNGCLFLITLGTLALQLLHLLTFPIIIALSFVYGTIWAFNLPSMLALVKDLVTDQREFAQVMGAAASNGKIGQMGAASGFGYIYAVFAAAGVYVSGLIFNGVAFCAVLLIKTRSRVVQKTDIPVREQIATGIRYVTGNPPLLLVILLGTVVSTVFSFVLFELPVIDADFLHGNKMFLSALYFAGGLGGLTSGIYMLRRKSPRGILWFMVFCTFLSGASVIVLGYSHDIVLSTLCTAGIDFAFIGTMGVSNTVLQLLTDEERRGRVLGINTMGAWGIMAVMLVVLGTIAGMWGITFAATLAGLLCFVAAGIYLVSLPWQRRRLQVLYMERGISPGDELI
jgi:MFS family permease